MTDDVMVSFGGNTAALNRAIDEAKKALAGFAPAATGQAKSSIDELTAALRAHTEGQKASAAGWRENLQALASFVIVARGAWDTLANIDSGFAAVEHSAVAAAAAISQASLAASFAADQFLSSVEHTAVETAASAISSAYKTASEDIKNFAATNGFIIGSFADQSAIMQISAAGGLKALQTDIAQTASETRAKMAQMEADYRHMIRTFATRDSGGRVTNDESFDWQSAPTLDVTPLNSPSLPSRQQTDASYTHDAEMAQTEASIKSADEVLKGFIADLQLIPDTSKDMATSIEASLTTIPNFTVAANAAIVEMLTEISSSGKETEDFAKKIVAAFKDAEHGGEQLAAIVGKIDDAEKQFSTAQTLAKSFQPQQAVAFYEAIQRGVNAQKEGLLAIDADYEAQHAKLNTIGRLIEGVVGNTIKEHETRQETIASLEEENSLLQEQAKIWGDIAARTKQEKEFVEAIKSSSTPTSQLDDLTKRKTALESRPQRTVAESGVTDAQKDFATRLAILEAGGESAKGQEAVVDVFRNRLASGRYGNDLDAVLKANRQFSAYKPDASGTDPRFDAIDTDSEQYQRVRQIVEKQFSANPNPDVTGGATHYLNPQTATDRSWIDKMTNVTRIGNHDFGNVDGGPVHSDDIENRRREGLQQTNTAIREKNALMQGGTEIELQQAAVAEKNLTQARDDIAAAKEKVELARKAMEASKDGTPQERAKAQSTYVQAQQSLNDLELAQTKALNDLKTAQALAGSKERLDIQIAALNVLQAREVEGSAKYVELEKQKFELTKAYIDKQKADAIATENATFANTMRVLKEKQSAIKSQSSQGEIGPAEDLAQTKAVNLEIENAEREHQLKIEEIAGSGTAAYKRAANALLKLNEERRAKDLAAEQAYAKQIEQTFKQSFEHVGSSVSSSLMQIIEGTGTARDLLRNVAKNVTSQFVDAGVKMVADWAAVEAKKVALSVLSQTQMTEATAAGAAARETLTLASLATSSAATVSSIFSSIQASAAETFAGIFGFLSPVMGPAAAAPAAAGQATVLGAASILKFDQGAWALQSDQLAMVHQGEMIVPKSETPWAQSLMAAAAGGGGNGGGMSPVINVQHTSYGRRDKSAIQAETAMIVDAIHQDMFVNRGKWAKALQGV